MRRPLPVGLLLLAAATAPAGAQGTDPTPDRSVLDGAYTAEQARRGDTVFRRVCVQCHAVEQFKDPSFQRSWTGRTVRDLFEVVRTQMPQDNPGGLPRDEYAAVLAYIFQLSGYPPGDSALRSDDATLRRVRIERKPAPP